MKKILIPLSLMSVYSIILLFVLSVFSYIFKWKADTALVGITIIYIVVGFLGGCSRKHFSYATGVFKKLLEGALIGTMFMVLLMMVSFFVIGNEIVFSSRFFLIWMLVVGSVSLGRIL